MKLKIKDLDIATGGLPVAIINKKDAEKLDLHAEDRIIIRKNKKECVAILDIAFSHKLLPEGFIGMFEESLSNLNAKDKDIVTIKLEKKPLSLYYIKEKLKGKELSYRHILEIVKDIVANNLSEVELTYFVAGCYINGLSTKETISLTKAIVNTGKVLKLKRYPILDKHCVGGIAGNRTTMIVVPIIAAAGLTIPKTSSRSITSAAGTADTMEVLANVSMSLTQMRKVIHKTNGCIVWGGLMSLAPADDKIIQVEHSISLDPVGQLLASILAKKKSVSATHLLIDIPVGRGAKIDKRSKASLLKRKFEEICKKLGIKVKVIITNGNQPVGNGIGPVLEARDVLWILKNDKKGSKMLRDKSIMLASEMLELAGKARKGRGKKIAKEILESGKAYRKFVEIVEAQGGKILDPDKMQLGKCSHLVKADKSGKIFCIKNKNIAKVAKVAGAPNDKTAGVYLYKHAGDYIKKGEPIFRIYSNSRTELRYAKEIYEHLGGIDIK